MLSLQREYTENSVPRLGQMIPQPRHKWESLKRRALVKWRKSTEQFFFYKALPMAIVPKQLDIYRISLEEYKETFPRTDLGLTDLQRITAEENRPDFDAYKEYRNENSQ